MITHEPLPLYEAFSFLTGIANDFSIEEFFEAMYIKHISKAEEYGKRCRILSELYRRLAASVTGGAGKNYSFVQHVHSARQSTGYAPVGNHSRVFHTEHDGFS